jgi:nitroreductase
MIHMSRVLEVIRNRKSTRAKFDPNRPVGKEELSRILEAARWAPTAHNMQNFEIIVIDAPRLLGEIGEIQSPVSATFIKENFQQLARSEEELEKKRTGILGTQFPPDWTSPGLDAEKVAAESGPSYLKSTIKDSPTVLVVLYDSRKRAPASEGDVLGFLSLGCVMENMWLAAEELGIGYQVMSTFSSDANESQLKRMLGIPDYMKISFAVRLGYPVDEPRRYLRVRREIESFTHHNTYHESPETA